MGILNATPDSYYAPSRLTGLDQLEFQAEQLREQGADWLDVGGCSTRPGASWPSPDEEWARLDGVFSRLRQRFGNDLPLSIDTFRSEIAQREGLHHSTVNELLRLTLLEPAIIQAILAGQQPRCMSLLWFQRNPLPTDWVAQRDVIAAFET